MLLGGGALGLPRLLGAVSSRICAQAFRLLASKFLGYVDNCTCLLKFSRISKHGRQHMLALKA
eukprot:4145666-Amphidinium_carterae.1